MRNLLFVISLLSPFTLLSQTIDWHNFSEETMNAVMFKEMNKYVKSLERRDSVRINPENPGSKYRAYDWHDYYKTDKELVSEGAIWRTGDSLVLSAVIQDQIMPRNYNLIKKNYSRPLKSLHNMEWFIPGRGNDLHDTLRAKIIEEYANPKQLESKFMSDFNCYGLFTYTEILESVSYMRFEKGQTYQDVAVKFINGWNSSPPHAALMNANYRSKVIVGVTTYYHRSTRTVFISFVHLS